MDYKQALIGKNYYPMKVIKVTDHSAVVKLKKNSKYFIGKFLDNSKVDKYIRATVKTEVAARRMMEVFF